MKTWTTKSMKTLKENKKEFVISPELKGVVTADYGTFIKKIYHKKILFM